MKRRKKNILVGLLTCCFCLGLTSCSNTNTAFKVSVDDKASNEALSIDLSSFQLSGVVQYDSMFLNVIPTYNIAIVPTSDINYTVNGKDFKLMDVEDYSKGFTIKKNFKKFTIDFDKSMQDVITDTYKSSNDNIKVTIDPVYKCFDNFKVVVSNYDDTQSVDIFVTNHITSITVDKNKVVF